MSGMDRVPLLVYPAPAAHKNFRCSDSSSSRSPADRPESAGTGHCDIGRMAAMGRCTESNEFMIHKFRSHLPSLLLGVFLVALVTPSSGFAKANTAEMLAGTDVTTDFNSEIVNGRLKFKGKITPAAYAVFDNYLANGGKSIVITSGGGDVSTSIRIARRLRSSEADLVVRDFCMSSCANYLFISAARKWLPKGAILGFHGAPILDLERGETDQNLPVGLREIYMSNENFLKDFGINRALFEKSHELTKLAAPILTFTITNEKSKWKHKKIESAATGLKQCRLESDNCRISVTVQSNSSLDVYFPSRTTLEKSGVVGIVEYSYPATKQSLRELANDFTGDLNLIGDFP